MATPFVSTSQTLTNQANAILNRNGREKVQWKKLPLTELPEDGRRLAHEAMVAECLARRAMLAFREWAADKVPAGVTYAYAIERGVNDPNMLGDMLYGEVKGASNVTPITTWSQFTRTAK